MDRKYTIFLIVTVVFVGGLNLSCRAEQSDPNEPVWVFYGTSDASAAAVLGEDRFVVADDENNVLRVYPLQDRAVPVGQFDLSRFLGVESKFPEVDIEGATRVGERIYWISSHGRNTDGKLRPNRYRFFATEVKQEQGRWIIQPVGVPCRTLVQSMVAAEGLRPLRLDQVTQLDNPKMSKKALRKLAPKEQGLNIEALCVAAEGHAMYIGFRNPLIRNKHSGRDETMVIPLTNFEQVIERQQQPEFGKPLLWNLAGRGIRSMEYSKYHKTYFVVAGPRDEETGFGLYHWNGQVNSQPVYMQSLGEGLEDFAPEAMLVFDDRPELILLSDDGSVEVQVRSAAECQEGELLSGNRCNNKHLTDPAKKTFQAVTIVP
jgi:hypothetical protein